MEDNIPVYGCHILEFTILDMQRIQAVCSSTGTINKELTLLKVSKTTLNHNLTGVVAATEQGEQECYIE